MKKLSILLIIFLLVLPSIFAVNLKVEKTSSNEVMIAGLKSPVIFNLKITNLGQKDNFEVYNLVGFSMFPIGTTPINSGETKEIELKISPIGEFDKTGKYTFEYFIKGDDKSEQKEQLTFEIIHLSDAFEIGSGKINIESNSIELYIKNKVNFYFKDINAKFSSVFFDFDENFDLNPNEKKTFEVKLNKEDIKKLTAGFYTFNSKLQAGDEKTNLEGVIQFDEKPLITSKEKNYGFFINTQIITKTNKGNIVEKSETIIKKNIFTRLFTNFSPEPDTTQRKSTTIEYSWVNNINPGETLEIIVKTNWLFPIILILFIILCIILAKIYAKTELSLSKKVNFVKTKGGEFALKVSITAQAKSYIERVNIIDRVPHLVKIHEKFGGKMPTRIDKKTKRIEWNFEKLEPGELRVISYIIYSKVGVVGKFALPKATAIYDKDGKIKETESNRAFFVSEEKEK